MGWESSPLAPHHCKWLVRLGRGPYTQEGETPGSVTLLTACGRRILLLVAWLRATGARGGAAMAGHDGMDFFGRAQMDARWEEMV